MSTDAPSATAPHAPARLRPVQVYRTAMDDRRSTVICVALGLWLLAHVVMGFVTAHRLDVAASRGLPLPPRPETPLWFSAPELQLGVRAFEHLGNSLLHSIAWQVGATGLFITGLIIVLTGRLRIIVVIFPALLFVGAALLQCIAYAAHSPYWAQGNAIFTLAFAVVAQGITLLLAPRNSGWRELRTMTRDLGRAAITNPVALFLGPIFAKDVRVLGRHRGTYIFRAAYPLALLTLVGFVYYAATSDIRMMSSGVSRVQRLQEIAPMLALFIAWTQFLALLFIAAGLTSSAICDERRTRTLGSLMTTPMNATQIVMGKLSSRLVQLLIIGLISLPFLLGIRVFGGLDAETVTAFIAITITATLLMASLGILASIWSRKSSSAIAMAIVLFLLVSFGPPLVTILVALNTGGRPPDEILAISAPLAMVANSMGAGGGGPRVAPRELWVANSVINTALALGAIFLSAVSLRSMMLSEKALEAPRRRSRRTRGRGRRAGAGVPPGVDPGAPPVDGAEAGATTPPAEVAPSDAEVFVERETVVSDNPVLWRELRQPALGSRRMLIIASISIAVLLLWLYTEVPPSDEEPHGFVTMIGILIIAIQAAVVSTPTITNERESSTWLTLLTTPLTGRQVLFPKLLGSIRKLWFITAIMGAELTIGVLAGAVHPLLLIHLALIIVGTAFFLGGTGVFFSLIARRSAGASLYNILLALGLWMGLPIGAGLVTEFFRATIGRGDWLFDWVVHINPIALAAVSMEASLDAHGLSNWDAEMPSSNYGPVGFTILTLVYAGVGTALGVWVTALAAARFNRLAGRTS